MSHINFFYDVRIGNDSGYLSLPGVAGLVPDVSDISISSKLFDSFYDCDAALAKLLSVLSAADAAQHNKNFVIVTKKNPKISGIKSETETWDNLTLVKLFLADAELLKKSVLKYSVEARIKIDGASIEAFSNLTYAPH